MISLIIFYILSPTAEVILWWTWQNKLSFHLQNLWLTTTFISPLRLVNDTKSKLKQNKKNSLNSEKILIVILSLGETACKWLWLRNSNRTSWMFVSEAEFIFPLHLDTSHLDLSKSVFPWQPASFLWKSQRRKVFSFLEFETKLKTFIAVTESKLPEQDLYSLTSTS